MMKMKTKSKHIPRPMPEPPMPIPDPEPPPSPMKKIIVVIFVAALVLSCSLLTQKPEPQVCEADYYRGVYTLCMVLNAQMAKNGATSLVDCETLVVQAIEKDWHDLEAPGFEWPLQEPVSGTSARR